MGDHRFMYPKVTPYVPGGNRRGSHGDSKAPKAPIVKPSAHSER
jgi:hypothetical protein